MLKITFIARSLSLLTCHHHFPLVILIKMYNSVRRYAHGMEDRRGRDSSIKSPPPKKKNEVEKIKPKSTGTSKI